HNCPVGVDARLVDLKVQSSSLAPALGEGPPPGTSTWWVAGGLAGMGLLAAALAWLAWRRRTATAAPAAVTAAVSFRCPGGRRGLKGKPERAGKKVKCPQCGQAVPVPGPREVAAGE